MAYQWCHGPKCHTNRTQDRIRGVKGNKVLRTRKITENNWNRETVWSVFCSQGCYTDFMNRHWAEQIALHPRTEPLETPIEVNKINARVLSMSMMIMGNLKDVHIFTFQKK